MFAGGRELQLHAMRISADSLSGVPFIRPVDCDSCRVRFARTEIDSIRLGDPTAGLWSTVGLVVVGPVLVLAILCLTARACPGQD